MKTKFFFLSLLLVSLTSCESVKSTLGLDHYAPDEFEVSNNPPLTMPSDFSLRPPKEDKKTIEGAIVTQDASQRVHATVFKEPIKQTQASTQSDKALLNHLNEQMPADPSIRQKVQEESHIKEDGDNKIMNRLKSLPQEIKKNLGSLSNKDAKDSQSAKA
jgi:hypothetical protein